MKDWLARWWPRRNRQESPKSQQPDDVMGVARSVEILLDGLASRTFSEYGRELIHHDVSYVVPAIWGVAKETELTATQKSIYEMATPVLSQAASALEIGRLGPSQQFAIGYILRSLVITKLGYMLEAAKRQQAEDKLSAQKLSYLDEMEPVGRA